MCLRYFLPAIFVLGNLSLSTANTTGMILATNDTIRKLDGMVMDAEKGHPIKATIFYEKMPYGNDIGIIHTQDSGSFSIILFTNHSYRITVKADNYLSYTEIVDRKKLDKLNFYKEFRLKSVKPGQLIKLESLNFEQGKFEILEESFPELEVLSSLLNHHQGMIVQLEGHTDFRGNKKLNLKLSQARVDAVKDFLTNRGIHKKRIKTKAFGGSQPITRDNTEEARKENRRVEVRILRNE